MKFEDILKSFASHLLSKKNEHLEGSFMKSLLTVLLFIIVSLSCGSLGIKSSGLVEVGSIYGFITNQEYEPINSAQVMLAGEEEYKAYTNTAGYFMLQDLAPRVYNLIVTKSGFEAQNLSVRVDGGKKLDLSIILKRFEMKKGMVSGMVVDYVSNDPLVVEVAIEGLGLTTLSDSAGHYTFENLPPGTYLLKIQAVNYISSYTDVTVLSDKTTEIVVRMFKAGSIITLHGIEFEFGSAKIKSESHAILDDAASILTNYPRIEVEIQGHTDNIGSDEFNLKLSQKRAEAVRDYLIDVHMIEPVRLIPRGYGETQPITTNDTDEGRAKNRRVDFKILK